MITQHKGEVMKAFRASFPHTLPIFAGFWFWGLTYGMYMNARGFSFWYPMIMSLGIFAGSMEFVTAGMLLSTFAPFESLLVTLIINARHIFYGLSLLDYYRGHGWKTPYLIFGMCDESFSINYTTPIPAEVDRGWFMLFITGLIHFYWFSASTIGGIFGSLLPVDTTGLEFTMTAMFVVIFLEHWHKEKEHTSSILGVGLSLVSLMIWGPKGFILPAMVLIIGVLTYLYHPFRKDKKGDDTQ